MLNVIRSLLFAAFALFRTRSQSAIEILALRHQLGVLQRSAKRPRLTNVDRGLWVLLSRRWCRWKDALIIVKPATVIKWHRAGFRRYWAWRSRPKGAYFGQAEHSYRRMVNTPFGHRERSEATPGCGGSVLGVGGGLVLSA